MPMKAVLFVMAAWGFGACVAGQAPEPTGPSDRVEKVSRPGVWQPPPDGRQIALWPDDLDLAPPDTGDHPEETGNGSRLVASRRWYWASYVTRPTMTIFSPESRKSDSAIVVLPGGGYAAVATDLEGTEICDWVTAQGTTCVLLKYRVPQEWVPDDSGVGQPPEPLLPLEDAQRAIGLLRHGAASHGINPRKIGVLGFSAGAHLAAALSNAERRTYPPVDDADRESSIPDFAVLVYPGRLWDRTLCPTDLRLAPWVKISDQAPPTLLIHAMDDPVDDVRHSMAYGLALHEAGVPVDLRLYAQGGHAFGLRETPAPVTSDWPEQVGRWLRDLDIW